MSAPVIGSSEPALILPFLRPLYHVYYRLYWPMIRLVAGGTLFLHGYAKLSGGLGAQVASMAHLGVQPALPAALAVMFLETIGALCIVFGLFTRFFAAAICIEFIVLLMAAHPKTGPEYVIMWGVIMLAIAMRGGGSLSLDQAIGREL
jgi:putative oxidoreductase